MEQFLRVIFQVHSLPVYYNPDLVSAALSSQRTVQRLSDMLNRSESNALITSSNLLLSTLLSGSGKCDSFVALCWALSHGSSVGNSCASLLLA